QDDIQVLIQTDQDIVTARQKGRSLAAALNFSSGEATLIATAISELARNIVAYAKKGEILLKVIINGGSARHGIQVVARDDGPGHGADAAHGARMAAAILEAHSEEPPLALILRCHEALRSTRGVVMSLAALDAARRSMTWLGIGNVQGILLRDSGGAEESLL